MRTFYILDISGSMCDEMVMYGKHVIESMLEDNQEIIDQDALVLEWHPLVGHLTWLVEDCQRACPKADIWFVGNSSYLLEEYIEQVNKINVPCLE